jgi:NAD(P)-dependent dehydrogenase (short-subunit alcohol dehydrogenase family)
MTDTDGHSPGLAGRVAAVTGGARGIGAAIATTLAAHGVAVAVSGRDRQTLGSVVAAIRHAGGNAHAVLADVTNPGPLLALRTQTERLLGPVELVAAVAGGQGEPTQLTELSRRSSGAADRRDPGCQRRPGDAVTRTPSRNPNQSAGPAGHRNPTITGPPTAAQRRPGRARQHRQRPYAAHLNWS